MEMISAEDIFYLKKVENLEREYRICVNKLEELEASWEEYLQFENFSILEMNMISDQRQQVTEIRDAIEKQINRLKLETLN